MPGRIYNDVNCGGQAMRLVRIIRVMAFGLLLSACVDAQQSRQRITITVVDEVGAPVAGAQIIVRSEGSQRIAMETDFAGRGTYETRTHASYKLEVTRPGFYQRIVEEVRTRTGHIVSAAGQLPVIAPGRAYPDSDGDGMADDWEVAHGLDPNRFDAWGDRDRDGWTNLDEFLEARSRALVDHR